MDLNKDNQRIFGIILSFLSVLLVLLCFIVSYRYPFISVDEWYTKGLLYFKISELLSAVSVDVHPPLYYIILKMGMKILNAFNIQYDLLFYIKFMSLIPYLIILTISFTKIRKEYGLFTAGLFSFTLMVMSGFFVYYMLARMYSWTLLFLFLSFLSKNPRIPRLLKSGMNWKLGYTFVNSYFALFILFYS